MTPDPSLPREKPCWNSAGSCRGRRSLSSLAVQLFTGDRDAVGVNALVGVPALVCAPLVGFMFDAGRKLALVWQECRPAGAVQLCEYQGAVEQQLR